MLLDVVTLDARIDSPLDDAEGKRAREAAVPVARPDGLWEWQVRRDFVRLIRVAARADARRLATTLAGTRTKRRFEVALGLVREQWLVRAFQLHRRRRLRGWASRVLRAALAGFVATSAELPRDTSLEPRVPTRKKSRRRRPAGKRRGKYVPYVGS